MTANPRLVLFCPISQGLQYLSNVHLYLSVSLRLLLLLLLLLPDISTMFLLVTREQCKISAMFIFTWALLTKGQFSCSKSTLSLRATLYYDGITATHSAPRSPICLLAIFTSREKPSRYIRWSLVCGVVYYIKYITIECREQQAGYRAPDRVRTSHTNPHCPAIPIPAKSDP